MCGGPLLHGLLHQVVPRHAGQPHHHPHQGTHHPHNHPNQVEQHPKPYLSPLCSPQNPFFFEKPKLKVVKLKVCERETFDGK